MEQFVEPCIENGKEERFKTKTSQNFEWVSLYCVEERVFKKQKPSTIGLLL